MESNSLSIQFQALSRAVGDEVYPSLAVRRDRLARLEAMLRDKEALLCDAMNEDYGHRSKRQSAFADITTTLKSINHARRHLRFWMAKTPRQVDMSLRLTGARSYSEYVPKGVVGVVSPWNFPVNLTFSPVVSAFAAGNRVFIKPSEVTPATAEVIQTACGEYFQPDEMAVACGGVEVAKQFVELPFDHLIYTGGEVIAKSIMAAAANNLVPLTLELGGKSPVIIADDADLSQAAKKVAFGKIFNAGQICIAPDYLMLNPAQLEPFVSALEAALQHMASAHDSDGVDVVNDRHRQRIDFLVDEARQAGADVRTVQCGTYRASIVINPDADMAICSQEIFGPVVVVRTCKSVTEQLAEIAARPHPLVAYYFGRSSAGFEHVARQIRCGALVKNDIIFQYANDDFPFGGVGASGMGKYRGIDGFKEFSNLRPVFKSGAIDTSSLVTPPYPRWFEAINNMMRKL